MKKIVFAIAFAVLCLFVESEGAAQTGTWSGKLEFYGNSVNLVFHLDDGACKMDSPDQGIYGVEATLERSAAGLSVAVPSINAVYKGTWLGKMIVGTYTQRGQSFPLTLKAGGIERKRPQTPVGPFPYLTEEVRFTNGDASLAGTLTLPENADENTLVLIMVTGSGLQNRDEEIYEHKPFAVIADALARQGIATLRYDDRGFGESTGDVVNVTTEDLKNDALAGISLLRTRFSRVGVLGHSEGGTIALMLASEGKADFVVSLAGAMVSGKRTLLWQNRISLLAAGYDEAMTEQYCTALAGIFDHAIAGESIDLPDVPGLPSELVMNLAAVAQQCATPYMRYFLALDVSDRLADVSCPVLALNGTKDRQVSCEENLGALREAMGGRARVSAIDGLNHMFQHCATGNPSEYKDIEETIAPEVLEAIVAFCKTLQDPSA